ncbi:class I SAM-dependent methyltransferase family protein [Candidatus Thorarchaeota archaeon]|nr:MAG: class I SAM-dependent methyltransferase family protein [Candidatus Thorarchaeota archaeon]
MRFRDFLIIKLGNKIAEREILPSGFHLVGHVALLNLNSSLIKYSSVIGRAVLEYDHRVKSVAVKIGPTIGVERNPSYKVIIGDCNTVTTHIENGIHFRLDPIRLTFSGGNRRERIELPKKVEPGERIVDMFSCVGQFALHLAKKRDIEITAIEINPEAYRYLVENIKLNGFDDIVTPVLGDCRLVHPRDYANRVVMGYLHDTITFLPYALDTLVGEGGTIHMHMALSKKSHGIIVDRINEICKHRCFNPEVKIRKIKNYSPGIAHCVYDIVVKSE